MRVLSESGVAMVGEEKERREKHPTNLRRFLATGMFRKFDIPGPSPQRLNHLAILDNSETTDHLAKPSPPPNSQDPFKLQTEQP